MAHSQPHAISASCRHFAGKPLPLKKRPAFQDKRFILLFTSPNENSQSILISPDQHGAFSSCQLYKFSKEFTVMLERHCFAADWRREGEGETLEQSLAGADLRAAFKHPPLGLIDTSNHTSAQDMEGQTSRQDHKTLQSANNNDKCLSVYWGVMAACVIRCQAVIDWPTSLLLTVKPWANRIAWQWNRVTQLFAPL